MAIIASISGLRATLPSDLSPSLIVDYANALSKTVDKGKIVVGRDGRQSGIWIEKILIGTLNANGFDVVSIGMAPTPTVQFLVEHSDSVAGIVITASHNPSEWNGLKFINKSGVFFNEKENNLLWENIGSNTNIFYDSESGSTVEEMHAIEKHIDSIKKLNLLQNISDIKHNFKVVVDAVNASGSLAAPMLLRDLGFDVVELFCSGSGEFPHTPEPVPANLSQLCDSVKANNADFGIAVDPDADRLVLVDSDGEPIGEEKTIALAVKSLVDYGGFESGNVVINASTSAMIEKMLPNEKYKVFRSAVGEINVVNKMQEVGAKIGGEGSGGVILPASHYGRDSLVGIALIASLMIRSGKSLSELSNSLPKLSMTKYKFGFDGDFTEIAKKIELEFNDLQIEKYDGVRVSCRDYWFQIRKSNTEPIIRIIIESESDSQNEMLLDKLKNFVKSS